MRNYCAISIGLRPGKLHAVAAGAAEFGGGLLLALGLLTPLAAVGAGDWSLDHALGLDVAGTGWALGALALGLLGGAGAVLSSRFQRAERHTAQPTA